MNQFGVYVLWCVAVAVCEVRARAVSDVVESSVESSCVPGMSSVSENSSALKEFNTSGVPEMSDVSSFSGASSAVREIDVPNVPDPSSISSTSTSIRQVGASNVPSASTISSSSYIPSTSSVSSATGFSGQQSSSESYESRPELEIISICSEVPTLYENLVNGYVNLPSEGSSTDQVEFIKQNETQLKERIEELKQYVNQYDERVSANDPDAQNIQTIMSSAVDELVQSVDKINVDLNSQLTQNGGATSVEDRIKTIQGYVRPAMARFEEFCLLETKDILKNVLQDFEASLAA